MNKDISSRDDVQSTLQRDVGEVDKLDATVQKSLSDEWNTASSQGSPESIFRKVVEKSDSSERMNLANSLRFHTPELVPLCHTLMQTDNVGERRIGGAATRKTDQDGIWRPTLSDIKVAAIPGESKTIIEK